jgi:hypothetical protein
VDFAYLTRYNGVVTGADRHRHTPLARNTAMYFWTDEATEARIRRRAKENGQQAQKCRVDGSWRLRNPATGRVFCNPKHPKLYGLKAEQIEARLEELFPRPVRELGPLAMELQDAVDEYGGTKEDYYVLSKESDPYALDTPGNNEKGAWLRDQKRTLLGTRQIHNRGLHYMLMSAEVPVIKPDGTKYGSRDWEWLLDVLNVARWLGYLPFDEITDEKNDDGIWRIRREPQPSTGVAYNTEFAVPDADALQPTATLDGFISVSIEEPPYRVPVTRQPYRIAMMGEKTSLRDVLGPISSEKDTDLVLFSGTASNTRIYEMAMKAATELAAEAAAENRELIVLYFADCDPWGWAMPTDVGRKLQALKAVQFPNLEYRVYGVALTPEQVKEYKLPQSPIEIKAKSRDQIERQERKRREWKDAMGVEQTEIDALATLRPDLLRQIALDAIAPFYDDTLDERVREAADEWIAAARPPARYCAIGIPVPVTSTPSSSQNRGGPGGSA